MAEGTRSTGSTGEVTVGLDIGTTSVKAVAVDGEGHVRARARIAHRLLHPAADSIEHDAARAWRSGPVKALASVVAAMPEATAVRGVCVAGMVPSMTAVGKRGVPCAPGILYDDGRARPDPSRAGQVPAGVIASNGAEGMLRWLCREAPDARGYWPAQAVASAALGGPPAIDGAVAISMGSLFAMGGWDRALLDSLGVTGRKLPVVGEMGAPVGAIPEGRPGSGAVLAGGTVDAFCDQIVSGAVSSGDVLVICGATLVVWIVVDDWIEMPGLWTVPHTVAGKVLIGGASNAGGLFVDWARSLLGRKSHNTSHNVSALPVSPGAMVASFGGRSAYSATAFPADPGRVPVWLPYLRGERVPYHDPDRRSSLHGLDVAHDAAALERAAYESSGFVVRHLLERAGVTGRRLVVSGGGTRSPGWMQALADCTGLPVDPVAVPEGAALGAAFLARMAAGLESSLDGAQLWVAGGARVEPDARWRNAAAERYATFVRLSEQG